MLPEGIDDSEDDESIIAEGGAIIDTVIFRSGSGASEYYAIFKNPTSFIVGGVVYPTASFSQSLNNVFNDSTSSIILDNSFKSISTSSPI